MGRYAAMLLVLVFSIGGCASKPVRHLASDASMITAGQSTRQDVLEYLGEPDNRRAVAPGVEEFLYYEDQRNQPGRLPLLNKVLEPTGYEMIVVTLRGDAVSNCVYRTFQENDKDRMKDYAWDEVK